MSQDWWQYVRIPIFWDPAPDPLFRRYFGELMTPDDMLTYEQIKLEVQREQFNAVIDAQMRGLERTGQLLARHQ